MFFNEQTPASLRSAVETFEANGHLFEPDRIREHAQSFSQDRFRQEFGAYVEEAWETFESSAVFPHAAPGYDPMIESEYAAVGD